MWTRCTAFMDHGRDEEIYLEDTLTSMTWDLALRAMEFSALIALSVANGLIAYAVFKIQRDRNRARLVMFVDIVEEEEERPYYALYVQNLGLVPDRQIRIVADVEEWRNGSPVRSKFHQKFQAFEDSLVVLKPQEFRRYELPYPEGWALVITVIAECSNGSDDEMYFAAGDHPPAVRSVPFRQSFNKKEGDQGCQKQGKRARSPDQRIVLCVGLGLA